MITQNQIYDTEWYHSWKDFAMTLVRLNVATEHVEDWGFYGVDILAERVALVFYKRWEII